MFRQLLALYNHIADNANKFTQNGLDGDFYIDIYQGQPEDVESFEYFKLPAIFVDYKLQGNGIRKPRIVDIALHILTDEMPPTANISQSPADGMNYILYSLIIQSILEGKSIANSTPLQFLSEAYNPESVINHCLQTWQTEVYLSDMIAEREYVLGEFERLNIFGNLKTKINYGKNN